MHWNDLEYERYLKYKQEINKQKQNNINTDTDFNSPLIVMGILIVILGIFEIWAIRSVKILCLILNLNTLNILLYFW